MTAWAGRVLGIAVAAGALLLPASRVRAQHDHGSGHHGGYRGGSHFYGEHRGGGYGGHHGGSRYALSGHDGAYRYYPRHRANYGRHGGYYAYSPYAYSRPPYTSYDTRWPRHSPSVRSYRYRRGHHRHQ
jgi:hypothetical protein